MTDEAKALVERLRQVSSVLFDDYGDGTHAVEDYALPGKAADLIETQACEIERLREALGDLIEAVQRRTADLGGYDGRFGLNKSIVKARAALGESHD